ncbi:MAG: DUF4173 domain-containing protein [Candidatus Limnocylindrales bacterium]
MTVPRPAARRILLLAVGAGILFDVLVPGNAAGLNAALVMAGLLVTALVVAGQDGAARADPADAWIPVAALAFAAMPAVRADDWLVAADLALAAVLGAGTVACLAGARITRGLVPAILALSVSVVVAAMVGAVTVLGAARRGRPAPGGEADDGATGSDATRRLPAWLVRSVPVLRGLLLAVPVLALFALLFASADAVFAQLARTALDWRLDLDLGTMGERMVVVSVVAWGVAGALALAAGLLPEMIPGRAPAEPTVGPGGPTSTRSAATTRPAAPTGWPSSRGGHSSPPPPPWSAGDGSLGAASEAELAHGPRLGTVEAATILALVDALFAGFVILQLAYLFGGRDTLSIAGLTYAEYARHGFFELVAVALLAGTLVVALDLAVAWRGRVQLATSLVLLGLTAIVLVSAFVRLRLYQDAYGWTELRFVVVVAIAWLAVALGAAAWLLLARAGRWTLHALGVLSLVTIAAMNLVGPQAFVADRNLERALDPSLVPAGGRTGLDTFYLASLGDEAVPAVVTAWPGLDAPDRVAVARFLEDRRLVLSTDPAVQGWPAWNLTRVRARDALATWTPATP